MSKLLGILLILLGLFFVLKLVTWTPFLFLLVAAGLAMGAATGSIGRWGFTAAVVFALLAVPFFLFKTVFVLLRLAPLLLVGFGIYVLVKALR